MPTIPVQTIHVIIMDLVSLMKWRKRSVFVILASKEDIAKLTKEQQQRQQLLQQRQENMVSIL